MTRRVGRFDWNSPRDQERNRNPQFKVQSDRCHTRLSRSLSRSKKDVLRSSKNKSRKKTCLAKSVDLQSKLVGPSLYGCRSSFV